MQVIYSETSSSGNCSVISNELGAKLIIDCGIKLETVNKSVKYSLFESEAIFVTHSHIDHIAYLSKFAELGITLHLNQETFEKSQLSPTRNDIKVFDYNSQIDTGSFVVKPFPLKHTSHREDKEIGKVMVEPCDCSGFLIYDKHSKEKMLWITDTHYVENQFPPVQYIAIECNYFEVDDYKQEIEYIDNAFVEKRRLGSHLSFQECAKFLNHQDLSKCKEIRLLHMSSSLSNTQKKGIADKMKTKLKFKNIEVIA